MELKENKTKKWTGIYKGVGFEINNWQTPPNSIEPKEKDCWTYYLYLHLDRIPEENKPNSYWLKGRKDRNRVYYDYYKHDVMTEIDWHGGITWYSKEHGFDGSGKVIKIGCDYSHLWDEGRFYDLETVKFDCKRTIERFLEKVPNYKHWCCGNGKLYGIEEGLIVKNQFYSKEYWFDKDWFKKAWEEKNLIVTD